MRALLLAAGLGTRLRPLTDHIPKCLVDINGRPLLGYWLDALVGVGVDSILVNLHHHMEQVEEFLETRADRALISTVYEEELLGTAGTVRANAEFFKGEAGLIVHADNLCTANLANFLSAHQIRPEGAALTMMIFLTDSPTTCGIVQLDEKGRVQAFHEKVKDPPGNLANAAIYVFEPEVVDFISSSGTEIEDISTDVLPKFLGRIFTWPSDGDLIDVGTLASLEKAQRIMADRSTPNSESGL